MFISIWITLLEDFVYIKQYNLYCKHTPQCLYNPDINNNWFTVNCTVHAKPSPPYWIGVTYLICLFIFYFFSNIFVSNYQRPRARVRIEMRLMRLYPKTLLKTTASVSMVLNYIGIITSYIVGGCIQMDHHFKVSKCAIVVRLTTLFGWTNTCWIYVGGVFCVSGIVRSRSSETFT